MELGRRLIVLTGVVVVGWLPGCSDSTPTSPSNTASAFVGAWNNVDPNTRDIPQLQIRVVGNTIYVHGYGACVPTLCDWGEASAPAPTAATAGVQVNWVFFFETIQLTLTLSSDGVLHAVAVNHFTDNSGRADYQVSDAFRKAS